MSEVLVTGGAGYIGTHVICALAAAGRNCISLDNYCNSSPDSIRRVLEIVPGAVEAFNVDIRNRGELQRALADREITSVIHLAGLKAVGESVREPDRYYDNNVRGTQVLLEVLATKGVQVLVFSSSATVYGPAVRLPIDESARVAPQSPYGENKVAIEEMLVAAARANGWRLANLRYFNPVGAHESGLIGEEPRGPPNNVMPFLCQVAARLRPQLTIFGNDYPTPDGTGVRDYIHVMDLAEGHFAALSALEASAPGSVMTLNLGTGRGYSVLQLVHTFERVNGVTVPFKFGPRRAGDVAALYADPSRALQQIGWKATRDLDAMCRDAWRWQSHLRVQRPAPDDDARTS